MLLALKQLNRKCRSACLCHKQQSNVHKCATRAQTAQPQARTHTEHPRPLQVVVAWRMGEHWPSSCAVLGAAFKNSLTPKMTGATSCRHERGVSPKHPAQAPREAPAGNSGLTLPLYLAAVAPDSQNSVSA